MSAETERRPFVLGLTGSIGMGKSTVAGMLRELGVPVFDADAEVHVLQGPNGPIVPDIEKAFPGTTGPQGVVREKLGQRVFGDPEALKQLESIVYPALDRRREAFRGDTACEPLVVYDVPLLFERRGTDGMDAVVVVSAPPAKQRERVMARDGMTPEKFENILALQMPDADKRARADYVIDTGVTLTETRAQVVRLVEKLRARPM